MLILGCLVAYPVVLLLCYLVLVALHEMGHALAALALAPGVVTVYLGSYGDPDGNWQLQLGRLEVYGKRNLLKWRGGCCTYQPMVIMPRWRQVAFVLAGPLLPLLVAGTAFFISFHVANGSHRLFTLVFFFVTLVSTCANLLSSNNTVGTISGQLIASDGALLRQLLFPSPLAQLTNQAANSLAAGNYAESADHYLKLLQLAPPTRSLRCAAIHVLFQAGRYAEALALSTQHHQDFAHQLTDDDRFGHALLLSRTDQHLAADALYSALIEQPQPYPMAYVNRGYTRNLLGNYALALADFDQAILLRIEPSYAYANRGLALLKLGQTEAGLAAIDHSLTLDSSQAYAFRNRGIYYLDRGEYAQAASCFAQAETLDPTTHALADYKRQTRQHLEQTSMLTG